MENTLIDLGWWITVIEIPAITFIFALIWRIRQDHDERLRKLSELVDTRNIQLREALAAFKLEVAKSYASIHDLKELEVRLVNHLLRIEAKLDKTALKTESLSKS